MQELDLKAVRTFLAVSEASSLTRAALRLGISKGLASRRLDALEAMLRTRLLTRTPRGVALTASGEAFLARSRSAVGELDDAAAEVAGTAGRVAGLVRLAAPSAFCGVVAPILARLTLDHPDLELDLVLDDARADLMRGRIDLALRAGVPDDSALVMRRVAPLRRCVVCSPAYVRRIGRPRSPADLAGHDCLAYGNRSVPDVWRFQAPGGQWVPAPARIRLRADAGTMLREAALAGIGIAILPEILVAGAIANGELVTLLDRAVLEDGAIYLVWPPGGTPSLRVRVAIDVIVDGFAGAQPM